MISRFNHLSSGAWIEYLPNQGGAIHQICFSHPNSSEPIKLLAADSQEEVSENPWFRGRFLFPFNDRIPGGKYSWEEKHYQIPVNDVESGDAIHGFAFRQSAEILVADEENGRLFLKVAVPSEEYYPFSVSFMLDIRLQVSSLMINVILKNNGSKVAPVCFGWHPYFCLPSGGTGSSPVLKIPAESFVPVDEKLLPLGGTAPVGGDNNDFRNGERLEFQGLDLAYTDLTGPVTLDLPKHRLIVDSDYTFFPYLQVFQPPDGGSVALEPITAATNAFNMPDLGLLALKPSQERSGSIGVSLDFSN